MLGKGFLEWLGWCNISTSVNLGCDEEVQEGDAWCMSTAER